MRVVDQSDQALKREWNGTMLNSNEDWDADW